MNRELKPDDLYDETVPVIDMVIALQKLIDERDLYRLALKLCTQALNKNISTDFDHYDIEDWLVEARNAKGL